VLPAALRAALDADIARLDPRQVTMAARALVDAYRATPERPSRPGAVAPDAWRAAYLELRVPATFEAIARIGVELVQCIDPAAVTSLLDLGTGPGTALHALAPLLPALTHATLVDRDDDLLDIAERLARALERDGVRVVTEQRDLADTARPDPADLVVMAYALGEVTPRDRPRAVERAWLNARQALVIIEPGTMPGFARILAARQLLAARGAHIAAPCPHAAACPMTAPDWCHIAVRVERTRRMRQIKHADLGYEDEAISYLVATPGATSDRDPRVVARPHVMKGLVRVPLCTATGLEALAVGRRDPAWRTARRVRWGDRWRPSSDTAVDD
jgi:ribosomal protein RSM22 (predicted rRNA methylase)